MQPSTHLIDAERPRLPLFIPVAMGFGAASYYVLLSEPPLWPYLVGLFLMAALGFLLRKHWVVIYIALLLGAGLFGFVNASIHSKLFGHTVLEEPVF